MEEIDEEQSEYTESDTNVEFTDVPMINEIDNGDHVKDCIPYIKIQHIYQISGNITYSSDMLWDLLSVKEINSAFELCVTNKCLVNMSTPVAVTGSPDLVIQFVLINKGGCDVPINLHRNKLCRCTASMQKIGHVNLYKPSYDTCPHRQLFEIKPTNIILTQTQYTVFEIRVRYGLEGMHELEYELSLLNTHSITLHVFIHVLSSDGPCIFPLASKNPEKYGLEYMINLHQVCISDVDPPIQVLWLYNSYDKPVEYSMECAETNARFHIIEKAGFVQPLSTHPVTVMFKPCQSRLEEFTIEIRSGNFLANLLVSCEASIYDALVSIPCRHLSRRQFHRFKAPIICPIILSEDRISLVALSHGENNTILHLENVCDKCVAYKWDKFILPDLVTVQIKSSEGIIPPFHTISTRVCLSSKGPSCICNVALQCIVTVKERQTIIESSGNFLITEKGYSEPISPPLKKETSYNISLTIAIRVIQCNSSGRGLLITPKEFASLPAPPLRGCLIQAHIQPTKELGSTPLNKFHALQPEIKVYALCEIFDRILWDTIFCPLFKTSLNVLAKENMPHFSQLKDKENSNAINMKNPYLSLVMQEILYDVLHDAIELSSRYTFEIRKTPSNETCIALPDYMSSTTSSEEGDNLFE